MKYPQPLFSAGTLCAVPQTDEGSAALMNRKGFEPRTFKCPFFISSQTATLFTLSLDYSPLPCYSQFPKSTDTATNKKRDGGTVPDFRSMNLCRLKRIGLGNRGVVQFTVEFHNQKGGCLIAHVPEGGQSAPGAGSDGNSGQTERRHVHHRQPSWQALKVNSFHRVFSKTGSAS